MSEDKTNSGSSRFYKDRGLQPASSGVPMPQVKQPAQPSGNNSPNTGTSSSSNSK